MTIVIGLALLAVVIGWLIGRPLALIATVIMPLIAIVSRVRYENRYGVPPEGWGAATALFTVGFAACIALGVKLRNLVGSRRTRR